MALYKDWRLSEKPSVVKVKVKQHFHTLSFVNQTGSVSGKQTA